MGFPTFRLTLQFPSSKILRFAQRVYLCFYASENKGHTILSSSERKQTVFPVRHELSLYLDPQRGFTWLRRLVASLSPRWPEFDIGTVLMRSVADKVALWQDFFASALVFPCQCHHTSALSVSSSICCSYWDTRAKRGNLRKTMLSREELDRNTLLYFINSNLSSNV
jgi:hypothetical protein